MIGRFTPVTYLLGGRLHRAFGSTRAKHLGLLHPDEEGSYWCRGWWGRNVAALRVAHALRITSSTDELPAGWTSSTYAVRLGP